MKLSRYSISRNNMLELMHQRDMFSDEYFNKRMRLLVLDVIGYCC